MSANETEPASAATETASAPSVSAAVTDIDDGLPSSQQDGNTGLHAANVASRGFQPWAAAKPVWKGISQEEWAASPNTNGDTYCPPTLPRSGTPSPIWSYGCCLANAAPKSSNFVCLHPVRAGSGKMIACGKRLNYPEAENIWRAHFKSQHSMTYTAENKERAAAANPFSTSSAARGGSGGNFGFADARAILTMQVHGIVWCIATLSAFATLHDQFFKSFAAHLNPCFRPPSFHTIRKVVRVMKGMLMRAIYEQLLTSLKFFGGQPFASVSVDMWSARHANMGYAALDVQFGDPRFGITEATLAVGAVPGTHDAPAIKEWVEKVVKEFHTLNGVLHPYDFTPASLFKLAVIDGGSNIQNTFRLIGISILYCMAHKLHLCVKRALGQYGQPAVNLQAKMLGEKHRKQVTHFSKSPKNTQILLRLQKDSFGTAQRCLQPLQDVVTRWTSTASSWARSLLLRKFFLQFFSTHDPAGKFESTLTPAEYNELRANLAVIQPAKTVTEFMQRGSSVTISMAWPRVMAVALHCKNVKRQPSLENPTVSEPVNHADLPASAQETARVLESELNERFGTRKLPVEQAIAMALDPRSRGQVAALPDTMQQRIFTVLSSEVRALRVALGKAMPPSTAQSAAADIDADDEDFLDDLLASQPAAQPLALSVQALEDQPPEWQQHLDPEVLLYFQSPPIPRVAKDFDPLTWWKEKFENAASPYSELPVMAAMYLSMACTAARNERTFSCAGRLLESLRSTMDPDLVGDMLFIQRNLHLLQRTVQREQSYKTATGTARTTVDVKVVDVPRIVDEYIASHGRSQTRGKRAAKAAKPAESVSASATAPAAAADLMVAASESDDDSDTDQALASVSAQSASPAALGASDVNNEGLDDDHPDIQSMMDAVADAVATAGAVCASHWARVQGF